MKRLFFAAAAALGTALAGSASAADLPRRPAVPAKAPAAYIAPAYNWTGLYLGINGGGGWGTSRWTDNAGTTGDFDLSGGLVGGTVGYNWQAAQAVFGIEGDLDWSNIDGTTSSGVCGGTNCKTENSWLGTARGRLGYAGIDRVMPYVTGGLAFGDIKSTVPGFVGQTDTKTGWTAGGGVEFALPANWTAKGEYLYADLGDTSCAAANCGGTGSTKVEFKSHLLRGGLNYKF
ncbi:MAG TPA: outer membrane protein [Xanthobacteraceae bacterium]|nr:outer membrane protein [Xanthobacteraceae bacterium]